MLTNLRKKFIEHIKCFEDRFQLHYILTNKSEYLGNLNTPEKVYSEELIRTYEDDYILLICLQEKGENIPIQIFKYQLEGNIKDKDVISSFFKEKIDCIINNKISFIAFCEKMFYPRQFKLIKRSIILNDQKDGK